MTGIVCGERIWNGPQFEGAAGCLISFTDAPDRILLVTAGHAILPSSAKQNDPVTSGGPNGPPLGRLRTWSELDGSVTVDVALIWINPRSVSPMVLGLDRPPKGPNLDPKVGTKVYLPPTIAGGERRSTTIAETDFSVVLDIPTWEGTKRYNGQLRTSSEISEAGDSGMAVLDDDDRVVGILVAGVGSVGDVITPISAVLGYPGWNGTANLVTVVPDTVAAQPSAGRSSSPTAAPLPPLEGTSFGELEERYEALFSRCQVLPRYQPWVSRRVARIIEGRPRYDAIENRTGAPWWFVGIVHSLECGCDFTLHLHNGDPLQHRTVRVPAGRPLVWSPPNDWETSAVDAITSKQFDQQADWSLAKTLYRLEGFNGYGYYSRGINSPYLWSFSNLYSAGKYIADHVYSPTAVSEQCGAGVLLRALVDAGKVSL